MINKKNRRSVAGICSGLREVRVKIPTAVKKGGSAVLNCWYDTEGDPLYAVKWYKVGREFYRYAPNETPVVKTFPIGNLTVKVSIELPPFSFPRRPVGFDKSLSLSLSSQPDARAKKKKERLPQAMGRDQPRRGFIVVGKSWMEQ